MDKRGLSPGTDTAVSCNPTRARGLILLLGEGVHTHASYKHRLWTQWDTSEGLGLHLNNMTGTLVRMSFSDPQHAGQEQRAEAGHASHQASL